MCLSQPGSVISVRRYWKLCTGVFIYSPATGVTWRLTKLLPCIRKPAHNPPAPSSTGHRAEENQPGTAPPLLLCPSQGHCVRAGALSGCGGSVSLRQELVVVGSGRQGAACRHTAHLRISSSLKHFRFFHPIFCVSHSSIDDIAVWRDMTGPAPGTTQMTAPCYQLNFSGIFCLVVCFFFFLQPPNTRSLFPAKVLISLQLNCNKAIQANGVK